jgi:hypothetical protein
MARTERDVKAALEVARHREDSCEGKMLRAAGTLKKARATRKRLVTELRKLQEAAKERRKRPPVVQSEPCLDLDALDVADLREVAGLNGEGVDRG